MAIGNKAQGKQGLMWAAVLVVGYILLSQAGVLPKIGGTATTTTTTTTGGVTGGSNILQTTVSDVTAYFDSYDKYSANTEITNGNHRVFLCAKSDDCGAYPKNYVDKGFLSDGGSVKCAPGDKGVVFFGLNSTTYYPVRKDFTCPQTEGVLNVKSGLAAFDTTPTITVFRDVGDVWLTSNQQVIGANDELNLKVRVQVTSKQAFGDIDAPGKGSLFCFQYNQTCFTSMKLDGRTLQGTPNYRNSPAGLVSQCYDIPNIGNDPGVSNDDDWTGTMVVKAQNINAAVTDSCSNVTALVYDTSVDLHTDTLAEIDAVQDELGNDVGQTGVNANVTLQFS